jgi:hypothetical protein
LLGLVGGLKKVSRAGRGGNRCAAALLAEVKGWRYPEEGAMTVAELIDKLSALPDKTARVVKSAGPFDGLNEPSLIYDGYVDKDMQFPVQATDPDAIHVVFL